MRLLRAERDWYAVGITEDVSPSALTGPWEANFTGDPTNVDGWKEGQQITVHVGPADAGEDVVAWAWLVAGPDYDADADGEDATDTVAVITGDTCPLLRNATDPVLDIEDGPEIYLR